MATDDSKNATQQSSGESQNYHIFWNWSGSYQYYQTSNKDVGDKFYGALNNGASRVMIYQGKIVEEWYYNDTWKENILNYVILYLPLYRVVWHWDGKYQLEEFYGDSEAAYELYNSLNSGASRLLSVNDTIPTCWYFNQEWKKNIITYWLGLTK